MIRSHLEIAHDYFSLSTAHDLRQFETPQKSAHGTKLATCVSYKGDSFAVNCHHLCYEE